MDQRTADTRAAELVGVRKGQGTRRNASDNRCTSIFGGPRIMSAFGRSSRSGPRGCRYQALVGCAPSAYQ